jgi:cytidyltransferase-like protein
MIAGSVSRLRMILDGYDKDREVYMTSGGFDPIHVGHIRCIKETALLARNSKEVPFNLSGIVVVVVNSDLFLERKKGYSFMKLEDRMEIIDSLVGVDFVVPWNSYEDQTVCGAIEILKPNYFTKGGDRFDAKTIPEWNICEQIGCKIITGVGGDKIRSSSHMVLASKENTKKID